MKKAVEFITLLTVLTFISSLILVVADKDFLSFCLFGATIALSCLGNLFTYIIKVRALRTKIKENGTK